MDAPGKLHPSSTKRQPVPVIRSDLSIPELRTIQHRLVQSYLNVLDVLDKEDVSCVVARGELEVYR